jgi:predicted nucleotidyltransferase
MTALSAAQRALVDSLSERLSRIPGVSAVVLGGSFARGRATPESDLDLGVFYRDRAPIDLAELRALAREVDDRGDPVVTEPYQWGPWVNGGAWLTVKGQRVDFLYRSVEHVERTIAEAEAGKFELHYGQQPPFGFFSPTYLGEVAICVPLWDPAGVVAQLKERVRAYPAALRRAVIQTYVWGSEFALESFASKLAARGDVLGTVGCLARVSHQLSLALFALNERWWLSDKTALEEIGELARAPGDFRGRVEAVLSHAGATPAELAARVTALATIVEETVRLCGPLYRRPYPS